eukprot:420083-Pyramimonas_sp.AAC.1
MQAIGEGRVDQRVTGRGSAGRAGGTAGRGNRKGARGGMWGVLSRAGGMCSALHFQLRIARGT